MQLSDPRRSFVVYARSVRLPATFYKYIVKYYNKIKTIMHMYHQCTESYKQNRTKYSITKSQKQREKNPPLRPYTVEEVKSA
jgi:hypothetical protein